MNQPLKSLLARGRADQVVHKTNPKNKLICPRIFFLQYLNSPKWRRTNPGSRKIESFLGGTARPRSYRETTPIACDIVGADYAMSTLCKPQGYSLHSSSSPQKVSRLSGNPLYARAVARQEYHYQLLESSRTYKFTSFVSECLSLTQTRSWRIRYHARPTA